ncbi:hypothetical protein RN001_005198 [Aquatica leii]|uniref:Uncharacterized protein n=1 Tax=Aquatica leii TaxID=1421715 RepID=A0AAN7SIP9_9COLE|nr:hypothetical protein RN001_005198 [Aquatica leii]
MLESFEHPGKFILLMLEFFEHPDKDYSQIIKMLHMIYTRVKQNSEILNPLLEKAGHSDLADLNKDAVEDVTLPVNLEKQIKEILLPERHRKRSKMF